MTGLASTGQLPTALPPLAPSIPKIVIATTVSDVRVQLNWLIAGGSNVVGYNVYVDNVFTMFVETNAALVSGLTPATLYGFTVTSVDGDIAVGESLPSDDAFATTQAGTTDVIYVDNTATIHWVASTAYPVNTVVNAIANSAGLTVALVFEANNTGNSGSTQPVWPTTPGDTVVDSSITWTARLPTSWVYAKYNMTSAINAYHSLLPVHYDIWFEKFHSEVVGTFTLNYAVEKYDAVPALYRVDKLTSVYSPASIDPDTTPIDNYGSYTTSLVSVMDNSVSFFGVRSWSNSNHEFRRNSYYFEDCDTVIGGGGNGRVIDIDSNSLHIFNSRFSGGTTGTSTGLSVRLDQNVPYSILFSGCDMDMIPSPDGFISNPNRGRNQSIEFDSCIVGKTTAYPIVNTSDMTFESTARMLVSVSNSDLVSGYSLWDGVYDVGRASKIVVSNCNDSSGKTWIAEYKTLAGEYTYDTSTYLTSGYTDTEGSVQIGLSLASEVGITDVSTMDTPDIVGFFTSTGSNIVTIEVLENFTVALTKGELWLELYYVNDIADGLLTMDNSSREHLSLIPLDLSVAVWTNPLTGSRSVSISATISVAQVGQFYGIVKLSKHETGKKAIVNPEFIIS